MFAIDFLVEGGRTIPLKSELFINNLSSLLREGGKGGYCHYTWKIDVEKLYGSSQGAVRSPHHQ